MGPFRQARRWWQQYSGEDETPLDGDTPAWAVSLMIHVIVLLSLALAVLQVPPTPAPAITIVQSPFEEPETPEPTTEFDIADIPVVDPGAQSMSGSEIAEAVAPEAAEVPLATIAPVEDIVGEEPLEPLDMQSLAPNLSETVVAHGAVTGVGTTGAAGAVDRLTAEIDAMLDQRDTLVCWLFDQSVSLASQRKEIAARLDRVFEELGVNHPGKRYDALAHVVVAYGKEYHRITPHETHDVSTVVDAIKSIDIDDLGVEMTFSAIRKTAEDTRTIRHGRNLMIIVFTDEVGNDEDMADETTDVCRKLRVPVYVVGVPAPFGRRQVQIRFVEPDPEYDQSEQWPVVDQGPETLYPEVVRISGGKHDEEAIDSGFGPFSLSKLCAATNGIYFAVHPNRNASGRVTNAEVAAMASKLRYFFDPGVMRQYRPDYLPAHAIHAMLEKNAAKRALVEASRSSVVSPMQSPQTTFVRKDEATLTVLLGEAQKAAALLLARIEPLERTLVAGLADRAKIEEKRWRAGYDLAMGRILALKVRTFAYNSMLGQAKAGMKFKNEKNNTWELVLADDMSGVDSNTQKQARQAQEFLQRVVDEHPGTPWALLAAADLEKPLGYRWEERHTPIQPEGRRNNNNNNNNNNPAPPPDQKKQMLAKPKPKRNPKNL
jgi:hypothetical protein